MKVFLNTSVRRKSLFKEKTVEEKLLSFKGMMKEEVSALARTFFENHIEPNLNRQVIDLVNSRSDDSIVVVASGGLEEYITYLEGEMKIDVILAKSFTYEQGRVAEIPDAAAFFREDKLLQMVAFEKQHHLQLSHRAAITDSISDLPMLLYADEKIIVNPDGKELKQLAEQLQWQIIA